MDIFANENHENSAGSHGNLQPGSSPNASERGGQTDAHGAVGPSMAPGRAAASGDRPLRTAAPPPGPSSDRYLSVERLSDAAIVTLREPSLRETHAEQLQPELISLARLTAGKLVLDLSQVRDFSCAWINTMIAIGGQCSRVGGRLCICGLSKELHAFLKDTGLHRTLQIAPTLREARDIVAGRSPKQSDTSGLRKWLSFGRVEAA